MTETLVELEIAANFGHMLSMACWTPLEQLHLSLQYRLAVNRWCKAMSRSGVIIQPVES